MTVARKKRSVPDKVLLVHDSPWEESKDCRLQILKAAFRRAHIAYTKVAPQDNLVSLVSEHTHVLLCLEYETLLNPENADAIRSGIEKGAGLIVLAPYWDTILAPLMGLDQHGERPKLADCEELAHCVEDFLPGLKGLTLKVCGEYMDVVPEDVFAFMISDTGRPMAWCSAYGKGRAVTFNSDLCSYDWAPGFIVEALLRSQEYSIRPLANVAVVQIDDFPAAVPTGYREPVASRYSLPMIEFYRRIWLPDMLNLARRHEIPYTFLIPFNYDAGMTPPFDFYEWNAVKLEGDAMPFGVRISRELASDHELGLHGYNHQPFVKHCWKDESCMRSSLQAVLAQWQADALGPLPRTYVPPGNEYDETTVRVLAEECPTLTSICAFINEHPLLGLDHDFGPEPWNPNLFSMPRNTAGYIRSDYLTLGMLSLLSSMGVWCHMLHPDDITDTPQNFPNSEFTNRNSRMQDWRSDMTSSLRGLYEELEEWIGFTKSHYSWLRFMRSRDAVASLKIYTESDITVSRDCRTLTVSGNGTGYFELVTDVTEDRDPVIGPEIEIVSVTNTWNKRRYLLQTDCSSFSINM